MSLEALLCLEHELQTDGNAEAAEDLHRQVTTLARIAEGWRRSHVDRRRYRQLDEAIAP